MFFSGQNLLYTFHQSLTARHITVAAFKRYARSPENRTFKNYFRKTNPFTKYMHHRPQNALSRYITKHRRKQNPILTTFTTRIATTILETLQNLKIRNAGILPAVVTCNAGFQPAVFDRQNNLNESLCSLRQNKKNAKQTHYYWTKRSMKRQYRVKNFTITTNNPLQLLNNC